MSADDQTATAENLRAWFVADPQSDRIRFTAAGREGLAVDMARAGIDIRQIRTKPQALAALERVSGQRMARLASCRGQHPLLDAILAPLFEDGPTPC